MSNQEMYEAFMWYFEETMKGTGSNILFGQIAYECTDGFDGLTVKYHKDDEIKYLDISKIDTTILKKFVDEHFYFYAEREIVGTMERYVIRKPIFEKHYRAQMYLYTGEWREYVRYKPNYADLTIEEVAVTNEQ